jgi:hypothetical protein
MRRILLALTMLIGVSISFTSPAEALVPATNLHLDTPVRMFDSRQPGSAMTSGVAKVVPVLGSPRNLVNITLSGASQPTWLYLHPCGQPVDRSQPAANFVAVGATRVNLVPVDLPAACMTMFGAADVVIDIIGHEDDLPGWNYVAHPDFVDIPVSVVSPLTRFNVRDPQVPDDAAAVALWVSITALPNVSTTWELVSCQTQARSGQVIGASDGARRDNLFIVPIDATGSVCFASGGSLSPMTATVHRYGYLSETATATAEGLPYSGFVEQQMPGFVALSPQRLFDTRDAGTPVADGGVYHYQFTGLPVDATAVALNVTVTETSGPGYLSVYPCDGEKPGVSNLNATAPRQTIPNFVTVSLGTSHEICFFAQRSTHVLADLAGYYLFGGGDGYVPLAPTRLFDTRDTGSQIPSGGVYEMDLSPYVAAGTSAVVMNVTVTGPVAAGFITVYPCGTTPPLASNLNYLRDETRPNLVTVSIPANRHVCFFAQTQTHLLADLSGAYSPASIVGFLDEAPFRVFDTREPAGSPRLDAGVEYSLTTRDPYIKAVAWNVTVTDSVAAGYLTLYPCLSGTPKASNLNYVRNDTVPNFAIVSIDSNTEICFISQQSTHLIADEAGIFVSPLPFEIYYEGAPGA